MADDTYKIIDRHIAWPTAGKRRTYLGLKRLRAGSHRI